MEPNSRERSVALALSMYRTQRDILPELIEYNHRLESPVDRPG